MWAASNSDDQAAGLCWYDEAHQEATRIAWESRLSVAQAAGIIAAMSPLKSWSDNLKLAERVAKGSDQGHTTTQIKKAVAIRDGASPDEVLGGRKTLSFYWAILHKGKSDHVTVDRHILSAANGRKLTDHELNNSHRPRKQYTAIEQALQELARELRLPAAQVQATIWTTWIRINRPLSN